MNSIILFFVNTAHAVELPSFEGKDLGEFIKSLYDFSILIVGLAVFIQFLRAGYAYFFKAAGNASNTSDAKSLMTNAVIGAIILLSAYLILNTINPNLVKMDIFDIKKIQQKCTPATPDNEACVPDYPVVKIITPIPSPAQNIPPGPNWDAPPAIDRPPEIPDPLR